MASEINSHPVTPVSPYFVRMPTQPSPSESYHALTKLHDRSGDRPEPAPSTPSSPLSPALSISSSCLVDNNQEDSHKTRHKPRTSVLQTPPSRPRRQNRQQLLTPPITPPDTSVRKPKKNKEDDQSDLIIVKRRKLESASSISTSPVASSSNTQSLSPDSKLSKAQDTTNPRLSTDKSTTSVPATEKEESFTLTCISECIYKDADTNDEEITFICCDSCDTWQHNKCVGLPEEADELPELSYCGVCRPGWLSGLVESIEANKTKTGADDESENIFVFAEGEDGFSSIVNVLENQSEKYTINSHLDDDTVAEQKKPVRTYT